MFFYMMFIQTHLSEKAEEGGDIFFLPSLILAGASLERYIWSRAECAMTLCHMN